MKAVNESGVEVDRTPVSGPDRGVLRGLDVASLRRLLVYLMRENGVPLEVQCEVMRTSKATLYRDSPAAVPDPGP